ncbi:uncharacterized protein N7518_003618 [Penicillium psychrosexuale]|uniref:uncharacterized protein n=1 Tax=Penicillium psychrosexuale TaxID=1002107 RepID=UPI0025458CC2|nr:uncharacterized protein N7518_003618 [Penicillium psychrosexuale]KAJ5801550.1 hypothetical protein N7518_003618 [Penicillium psychrosexuale]
MVVYNDVRDYQHAARAQGAAPENPLLLDDDEDEHVNRRQATPSAEGLPYDPGREITPSDTYTPPEPYDN